MPGNNMTEKKMLAPKNRNTLLLIVVILLTLLALPTILSIVGAVTGLLFSVFAGMGAFLAIVALLLLVFTGAGTISVGIVALVGIILLALVLPFLAPIIALVLVVVLLVKALK